MRLHMSCCGLEKKEVEVKRPLDGSGKIPEKVKKAETTGQVEFGHCVSIEKKRKEEQPGRPV